MAETILSTCKKRGFHMLGAGLLLFVMLFGAFMVIEAAGRSDTGLATLGWALIVLPLFRYQVILKGLRRAGKIGVALLIVAVLALVVSGDRELWNLFF